MKVAGVTSNTVPWEILQAAGYAPIILDREEGPTPFADRWMERVFDRRTCVMFDRIASGAWNHLVSVSTQTAVRAESMYREGDALAREDFYQEAIRKWKSLVQTYRTSTWVPEALMRIGNTQAGLGQWAEASSTFNTLKQSYAGSEMGKEGAFQVIQCSFNQGKLDQAVIDLLSFAKQFPTYEGVCMGDKKQCSCGQAFFF